MTKLFSYLFSGDLHLHGDQKLIPADQFSTLLEAEEVLAKAIKESSDYKELTIKECETLKKQAQDEGFQEGLVQLNRHLLDLEEQARKIYRDTQNSILKLALQAAKKIVGKELELHPETIVDIVMQALAPVKQSHRITIFVHKSEKELLETEKSRIKELFEHLQILTIQERNDIAPGGCIIETESGIINASVDNQWKALEAAFQRYMK